MLFLKRDMRHSDRRTVGVSGQIYGSVSMFLWLRIEEVVEAV